ncbi:MAG TPA: amidohydrolase [Planctomycetota bacterium]|nr:amidohydrolase [Planctomycetota bacterium]
MVPDDELLRFFEARAGHYGELSRRIWEFAEVGYKETRSAALLRDELRAAGFRIEEGIGGIPTAFTATWGQGRPVVGILGEYDALPGLSQDAAAEQRPREPGGAGHGCGHNLFGAASAFAAHAVKERLAASGREGTVRFYGCPAEEGGGGKIYMVRAGAFKDCDVVLAWHPAGENRASLQSNLANITAKFRYHGRAAHAAGSPEKGRSALDAVALFTHAVDLLREHVPQATRLHYVITNGGSAPNVVPDFAEVYLYARHPEMDALDDVWARVKKCAEAGALATETRLEMELVNSAYNLLPNESLTRLFDRHLKAVGGVEYGAEEQAFAEALRKTFPPGVKAALGLEKIVGPVETGTSFGSTDVGDVSWVVPTAQFRAATFVPGTPGHSWQAVACSGSSAGRKGMVVAAKVLGLAAWELLTTPAEVEKARESFRKASEGRTYRSRLPETQKPPLTYRDKP